MEFQNYTGQTVEDALTQASVMLGVTSDHIEYEVIETEPAVKGNTTNNANKDAKIETGYTVKVPLFINQGEKILVSTKDGKYSGRA